MTNNIQKSFFQKYTTRIIGFIVGGLYLTLELLIFLKLISESKNDPINIRLVVALTFEFIGMPLFLIIGIYISSSTRSMANTFLWMPLIFGAGPSSAVLFLYKQYQNELEQYSLGENIIYIPIFVMVLWISLALFGIERRKLYLYLTSYMCIFFAVPIGVCLPLY